VGPDRHPQTQAPRGDMRPLGRLGCRLGSYSSSSTDKRRQRETDRQAREQLGPLRSGQGTIREQAHAWGARAPPCGRLLGSASTWQAPLPRVQPARRSAPSSPARSGPPVLPLVHLFFGVKNPARPMVNGRSGKMPTTAVRRSISVFSAPADSCSGSADDAAQRNVALAFSASRSTTAMRSAWPL
jgi:hypothetical protein